MLIESNLNIVGSIATCAIKMKVGYSNGDWYGQKYGPTNEIIYRNVPSSKLIVLIWTTLNDSLLVEAQKETEE